jgi:signal transduction histidine kinase
MSLQDPEHLSQAVAAAVKLQLPRTRLRHTLRVKVLVLLVCSLALFLVILFFPIRQIFLNSFNDLEQQSMEVDLTRALNVINNERDLQEKMVVEYGAWDDTYAFVEHPNPEYIDNNYTDESFINRRSNLVLVINADHKLVFGRKFDLATSKQIPLPQGIERLYAPESSLVHFSGLNQVNTSIVHLSNEIILLSAHPIITSLFEGPSRGTIIFGRTLDDTAIGYFSQVTQLSMQIHRPNDPQLLQEIQQAPESILAQQGQYVQPLDETTLAGYILLPDIDGNLGAVVRIIKTRDIYQRERTGLFYISLAVCIGVVLLAFLLMLLLERVVIGRLASLRANLAQIGTAANPSGRVTVQGNDELAQLATGINTTLAALEQAELDRQRTKDETIQMKQRFIATVSHELRTPLTPIQGYLDLLLLGGIGELSPDQTEVMKTIKNNVQHMTALVEDVLLISSLSSKGLKLQISPTDLKSVIAEVVELFQFTTKQKRITLTVDIADELPPVAADKQRLNQVIWNLLSNALKYTDAGGQIWLRARMRDGHTAEVEIEDTGVGLTDEQQQLAFTPFYRAANHLSITAGGTGLGLAIVQELVALHGGEICIRSTPNAGSTFSFNLPII